MIIRKVDNLCVLAGYAYRFIIAIRIDNEDLLDEQVRAAQTLLNVRGFVPSGNNQRDWYQICLSLLRNTATTRNPINAVGRLFILSLQEVAARRWLLGCRSSMKDTNCVGGILVLKTYTWPFLPGSPGPASLLEESMSRAS